MLTELQYVDSHLKSRLCLRKLKAQVTCAYESKLCRHSRPLPYAPEFADDSATPGGWDGRSRMSSIDTKKCPVYMLTGEYDWSNTPAMGQATCDKITGGKHQAMKGVGHFPATENPKVFVGYRK